MSKPDATERDAQKGGGGFGALIRRRPEVGLVVAIAVALGLLAVVEPTFFNVYTLQNFLHQSALYGVLALGAAVVIIAGGIDLSVGSVVALSGVLAGKLLRDWLPLIPGASAGGDSAVVVAAAIALCLLMGLLVGLFHAVMINQLGLPPFIATLATMAGLRSVAQIIEKNSVNLPYPAFRLLGANIWWTVGVFLALAAVLTVLMNATVRGRHLYALGGNEAAARLSGLSTTRLKAFAYGLAGMLSALGGLLFAGYSGNVMWNAGQAYELRAITAAVVGGCSLAGGVGSMVGTVLGVFLIQLVIRGTGVAVKFVDSSQIEGLVLGTVVVVAVAFNQRFRIRRG